MRIKATSDEVRRRREEKCVSLDDARRIVEDEMARAVIDNLPDAMQDIKDILRYLVDRE